jgi:F0F1-type ATP synthase assembly protein I
MVVAMQWVNQITTVALEMVLPAGLGYWLDGRWGTEPWLLVVGAFLGPGVALRHLMQLARAEDEKRKSGNKLNRSARPDSQSNQQRPDQQ